MIRIPASLLALSLASAGAAYLAGGGILTPWLAASGLSAIGAAILLARGAFSPGHGPTDPAIVVDGSNVMHWKDGVADLATVRQVLQALRERGFAPGVMFDANAGHKLFGRYLDDAEFARLLGLPADQVLVVPKGQPADATILAAAREMDAKILTDDRFRDWAETYPEVVAKGHLVRGGFRAGTLWLDEEALNAEPR